MTGLWQLFVPGMPLERYIACPGDRERSLSTLFHVLLASIVFLSGGLVLFAGDIGEHIIEAGLLPAFHDSDTCAGDPAAVRDRPEDDILRSGRSGLRRRGPDALDHIPP
ncbi:hypothetical protein J8273_0626 [Carpediemonas membranifera]|uniref:Uncharacterized protein n=1 Tax=Carpediemonas membranifera TaxID=201153 RepID=A0A8J6E4Y0_9EUKA|nr:hypothetical protein J8273_0626 [Carpediemonas membranifera]|eukprot:KAG9397496.1 hypothetical protein J8273_0626 [Carpediemonas membranifera]